MKSGLAWVLLLAFLSGCAADPVLGGRYACFPDAGADQCPGSWRCGLEGYCHALGDTSRRWRCAIDEDCENGWKCGLDEARTAGECHEPDDGGAYACLQDRHCSGGWHCGPALRCYDRRVPADYECRFDAGDCADGWRCGLNGLCQSRSAPAAYPCATDAGLDDSWCEQAWRCSPEGRCLDPASDALLPAAPVGVGVAKRINPLTSAAAIQLYSVSPRYTAGLGAGLQTIAFVQSGQLQARVVDRRDSSVVRYPLGPWADNVTLAAQGSRGEHSEASTTPDDVTRLFVVGADAGVRVLELQPDGGVSNDALDAVEPVRRVIVGSSHGALAPRVVGFAGLDKGLSVIGGDALFTTSHFNFVAYWQGTPFTATPGNRLVDLAAVRPLAAEAVISGVRRQFPIDCIFAADRRGLWVAQWSTSSTYQFDFDPIQVPPFNNDSCGAPSAARLTRLASFDRDWLGFSSTGLDGGAASVGVLDLRPLWSRSPTFFCAAAGDPCAPGSRIPAELAFGPCPACPGGRLVDFALSVDSASRPFVEVRCGSADGGTEGFFRFAGKENTVACERSAVQGEGGLFASQAHLNAEQPTPGQVTWAGDNGYIWVGDSSLSASSELLDRAAHAVARLGSTAIAFTPELAAVQVAGVGLVTRPSAGVVSAVEGAPEWIVTAGREVLSLTAPATMVADAPLVGIVGSSVTPFVAPHFAVRAQASTAAALVVTAGTSLFSAEVNPATQKALGPLALKVVSPSQIESVAFSSKAPADAYLRGFVVTPNGVFRLTAETNTRWTFSEVALPASLSAREVWFEGDRGRVGFSDGTVYSLPSRVPIAPPLPDRSVVDYAQTCGQQLALSPRGLFRLEPVANQTIGAWKNIPLPADFAKDGLAKGRLHGLGTEMFVFAANGEAAQLSLAGCQSP